MSRGERYARAREWRPFRKNPDTARDANIGPRGELWTVAEDLTPIELIDEKVVDKPPTR